MNRFVLCSGLYSYINSRFILFCNYLYIFRASSAAAAAVFSYIVRSRGYLVQPCDLFQKLLIYLFHLFLH